MNAIGIEIKQGYTMRACDKCKKIYYADNRNLKRGWGLCCSKKCAAKVRVKAINNQHGFNRNYGSDYGLGKDEMGNYEGIGATSDFD